MSDLSPIPQPMTPERVAQIRREREVAERREREAEQALADAIEVEHNTAVIRARLGTDRFNEGNILVFNKEFAALPGTIYRCAAIKSGGKWWVAGPAPVRGYDWPDFVRWVIGADPTSPEILQLFVVSGLTKLWEMP